MLVAVAAAGPVVLYGAQQRPACRSATRAGYFLCRSGLVRGAYDVGRSTMRTSTNRQPVGGLDFPGGKEPNGVAFVYFAYVIGMTAQTSDTGVTSNNMRRLVLTQGVFSFFFKHRYRRGGR